MVKEVFEVLLQEVGEAMHIPDLHPDRYHTCLINFPDGMQIQLDMDSYGQGVILGCDLGPIPSGRYRINYFREALKANTQPYPIHGILSYSRKTDHVILFETLPLKDLTGDKIADALEPFKEKALHWKECLTKGDIPTVSNVHTSSGMFGLRP